MNLSNEPFDPQDAAKEYDDELLNFDGIELNANTMLVPGGRMLFFDSNCQMKETCSDKYVSFHPHENVCSWSDDENNNAILYEILSRDVCRRFLLEVDKQRTLKKMQMADTSFVELHALCQGCIDERRVHERTVTDTQNFVRGFLVKTIFSKKLDADLHDKWMIVQCLLGVCPIVEERMFPPLFSVEEAGRHGWALTTYGPKPLRHVMFPGVALRMRSETGLLYTVKLEQHGGHRHLSMLGVSAKI